MYGLTLIWALAAVYGQQEAPIIRISTLVRRHSLLLSCDRRSVVSVNGRHLLALRISIARVLLCSAPGSFVRTRRC